MKCFTKYGNILMRVIGWILVFSSPAIGAEDARTVYVHSAKAPVYGQPSVQAPKITELSSGTPVTVLDRKGLWYYVSVKEHTGWIFKIMVREKPPKTHRKINSAQLAELADKARRRPSAYTTTASARGLKQKRDRFASLYKHDYHELEKMESMQISMEEANQFITDGVTNETNP